MNIRKLISAYKTKLLGQNTHWQTVGLLGKTLTVTHGCINKKADKDDAWWYALSQKHDKIFDIGANVGYSTILATLHQPDKQILLADPNPQALAIAKENLERNGLGINKEYINAFVGEQVGEQLKFYTLGTGSAGSMFGSHADSAMAVNAHYMVETNTLDNIVSTIGWTPTLVKVDVEAAESHVLSGAVQVAGLKHVIFMVEMHAPPEMPMLKNAGLILDWCTTNGYIAYYMKEHTQLTDNQQIAHRGRCHLLLLPEGMDYPEYLRDMSEGSELA